MVPLRRHLGVQWWAEQQRRCPGASLQPRDAAFLSATGETLETGAETSAEPESNTKGRTVTITTKARPSRRSFLKASAGTAALFAAVKTSFFAGVHGAAAGGPETTKAKLGFIALTDAGPLF